MKFWRPALKRLPSPALPGSGSTGQQRSGTTLSAFVSQQRNRLAPRTLSKIGRFGGKVKRAAIAFSENANRSRPKPPGLHISSGDHQSHFMPGQSHPTHQNNSDLAHDAATLEFSTMLEQLRTSAAGLSEETAAERLEEFGPNEMARKPDQTDGFGQRQCSCFAPSLNPPFYSK